jgi:hypothetical protein
MKVFGNEKFRIYVRELDHPPPHCHIRFGDKSEVCVTIPLMEPMYGATISREVRDAVYANLDALSQEWDRLHPKRPEAIKETKSNKPKKRR